MSLSKSFRKISELVRIFRNDCLRKYHKSVHTVNIPNIPVTNYLLQDVHNFRDSTALIDGLSGSKTSFYQLQSEILSVATGLKEFGLKKRDVVCLYGTNRREFIHVFCGVTANGAALTIANSQLNPGELSIQLNDTKSKYIIATPDCVTKAREAASKSPNVTEVLEIGHHRFTKLFNAKATSLPDVKIDPKCDAALLPYSSGTTGLPKGVILTHSNLVAQLCQLRHPTILPFTAGVEKSIACLPMVHIAGLIIGLLNPLSQGACTVVLPRFEPESYLKAIETFQGTFSLIAPPLVNFFANHPSVDRYDLRSLNSLYSGAAPLSKSLTEKMVERIKIKSVRQGYGMSETSGAIFTDPIDCFKYGSIGKPVPNTEAKLVSIEKEEDIKGNYESGEIWARGPQITPGYLNNEEATRNCITKDGWIKTGDIAYCDEDGHYFIVDRLKDIIKYKGYQISPAYLESILLTNDNVLEAGVVGVPAGVLGEVPKAFVVLKSEVDGESILRFANERVSPYKQLRGGLEIVNEIPKLPSGKILRRKLQQAAE